MTTFDQVQARAEAAQREYERAYGQLFRDEAQSERIYSDEEHEERVRSLQKERTRKIDALVEEIHATAETARKELATLEGGDPTAVLRADELATAAAKKPFIDDDVWATPAEELAGKLRAIMEGGDKAAVFAYSRAAASRFGAAGERMPLEVGDVLGEMGRFLAGPERLARAERARETVEAALGAESRVAPLGHGARSVAEMYMNSTYGR